VSTVLVLDQEPPTRERLASVIASAGHTVLEASDSQAALRLASRERPELAIVDILMPAMDGYEFVRRLRCDATAELTSLAFCATKSFHADLRPLAETCGVVHILAKTGEPEPILKVVSLALALDAAAGAPSRFVPACFDREYVHAIHASRIANGAELERLSRTHEQLNRELHSSHARYRALFELSPQPISVYDRATHSIVAVNDASVTNYGYSRAEFLSMKLGDLVPREDLKAFQRYVATSTAMSAGPGSGRGLTVARPWRHVLKDGSVIDVEVTSDDIMFDGRACRIVLSQDVTARKRVAAELTLAHRAAVEASTLKSAFLANVSHEMRTPMNGVIGMNGLLLATDLTPEQRAYAAQVARSGEAMMAIIDDVLDVAKIEAGGTVLDLTDFPLRKVIERACAAGVHLAAAKGLELELLFGHSVPQQAHGDGVRLARIITNLVSNAVKFTTAGSVGIHVSARPGCVLGGVRMRVAVADTGIGVDQTALGPMFEPFTQADASPTRAYGGVGLGLAIARDLVALMGGQIGAKSSPGRGSTFWFELELSPAVERSPRRELLRSPSPAIRAFSRGLFSRAPHGPGRTRRRCG
jgi:PAS domain S-box-containing protein